MSTETQKHKKDRYFSSSSFDPLCEGFYHAAAFLGLCRTVRKATEGQLSLGNKTTAEKKALLWSCPTITLVLKILCGKRVEYLAFEGPLDFVTRLLVLNLQLGLALDFKVFLLNILGLLKKLFGFSWSFLQNSLNGFFWPSFVRTTKLQPNSD